MTDKPKLKALLDLPWAELKVKLCAEIHEALGETGPWKHYRKMGLSIECEFCGQKFPSYTDWMKTTRHTDCPIPPPITDEPEVVAERLRDRVMTNRQMGAFLAATQHMKALVDLECLTEETWFAFYATPTQRIITCLLALGQIEE